LKRLVVIPFVFLLVALFFPRCAKIVAPTGGPKDTIPPVMLRSVPHPNATNFNGKRISFFFDEFVQLKDVNQKFILSPPQEKLPEIRLKGKSIDIMFAEEFTLNTTYTLYFSDAIVDNNEGNKLQNFEFAFSTGPIIDSLMVKGRVIDAYTLEPVEGVLVMLYSQFNDSIPLIAKPIYVSKTNKQGIFSLSNIKYSNYKIFALDDKNTNYIFDQPSERVAFGTDTLRQETLITKTAMVGVVDSMLSSFGNTVQLKLFAEDSRIQQLTDFSRPSRRKLALGFSIPAVGEVNLLPLYHPYNNPWYIREVSTNGDSINFWITDDKLQLRDTLMMRVEYLKSDSLQNLVPTADTLRFSYFKEEETKSRRGGDDKPKKKPTLKYSMQPAKGNSLSPLQSISFLFGMPLKSYNINYISIYNTSDSAQVRDFNWLPDSLNPRRYSIVYPWVAKKGYTLTALPGAFTNLDAEVNDTIKYSFAGYTPELLGSISLSVKGVKGSTLIQLISPKGKTLDQKFLTSDGTILFSYLPPENYSFRFVLDENRNGKWDTGYYLKGIQPERVIYFEEGGKRKNINVRKNWEYELTFDLEPFLK
jgi:hypothetical protein